MIKTKLILVDGISGSGKSTTAHYIARQLNRNGIKAKWYQEEEKNHPLHVNLSKQKKKENDVQYCNRFMIEFVKKWEKLVKKIQQDDTVYIVECFFFQYSLLQPIFMDLDKEVIKEFLHNIYNTIKSLNPALIHFYQEDVGKAMHRNWRRREA